METRRSYTRETGVIILFQLHIACNFVFILAQSILTLLSSHHYYFIVLLLSPLFCLVVKHNAVLFTFSYKYLLMLFTPTYENTNINLMLVYLYNISRKNTAISCNISSTSKKTSLARPDSHEHEIIYIALLEPMHLRSWNAFKCRKRLYRTNDRLISIGGVWGEQYRNESFTYLCVYVCLCSRGEGGLIFKKY